MTAACAVHWSKGSTCALQRTPHPWSRVNHHHVFVYCVAYRLKCGMGTKSRMLSHAASST